MRRISAEGVIIRLVEGAAGAEEDFLGKIFSVSGFLVVKAITRKRMGRKYNLRFFERVLCLKSKINWKRK